MLIAAGAKKYPRMLTISAFALVLLLAAPTAHAAPLFPLTVQLDWVANAQFAGLLIAKQKGWYAEQGLDVTIEPVNQSTLDTVGPVVRGHSVIGCADGLVLLRARQANQPIQAFATMLQASPLGILTLRTSSLAHIKDLRGKTIGLHAYDRAQLEVMLRANGLSLADVRTKIIGDDTTSLAAGKIDAQVAYLIDEQIALEQKGLALQVFPGYSNGYRTYSQVYFARADFLAGHAAILAKFLRASNRGWQEAFAHPDATAAMLVTDYLPGTDRNYQTQSVRALEKFATIESPQLGQMRLTTWKQSCLLFALDPTLAVELLNLSVLRALYGKEPA